MRFIECTGMLTFPVVDEHKDKESEFVFGWARFPNVASVPIKTRVYGVFPSEPLLIHVIELLSDWVYATFDGKCTVLGRTLTTFGDIGLIGDAGFKEEESSKSNLFFSRSPSNAVSSALLSLANNDLDRE